MYNLKIVISVTYSAKNLKCMSSQKDYCIWSFYLAISLHYHRALQKMKQVRRLKLEEVKVLAEEGIQLDAAQYQRQVEEREAQRRQEREERLAKEAMMTLEAMEREEQEAAAKAAETSTGEGKELENIWDCSLLNENVRVVPKHRSKHRAQHKIKTDFIKAHTVTTFWIITSLDSWDFFAATAWSMDNSILI